VPFIGLSEWKECMPLNRPSRTALANRRFVIAIAASVCFACATGSASAITVEIAKKCEMLTAKAFPPRQLGNPAAAKSGTGPAERSYFKQCVANGGKVDDPPPAAPAQPQSAR
jgi:hypothetical protein